MDVVQYEPFVNFPLAPVARITDGLINVLRIGPTGEFGDAHFGVQARREPATDPIGGTGDDHLSQCEGFHCGVEPWS